MNLSNVELFHVSSNLDPNRDPFLDDDLFKNNHDSAQNDDPFSFKNNAEMLQDTNSILEPTCSPSPLGAAALPSTQVQPNFSVQEVDEEDLDYLKSQSDIAQKEYEKSNATLEYISLNPQIKEIEIRNGNFSKLTKTTEDLKLQADVARAKYKSLLDAIKQQQDNW